MLSNKQSLALSGLMAVGIFVFGVLDVLDNFLVLTILTLIFFAIIVNIIYTNYKFKEEAHNYNKKQSFENK